MRIIYQRGLIQNNVTIRQHFKYRVIALLADKHSYPTRDTYSPFPALMSDMETK